MTLEINMKIALAQINPTVGDLKNNQKKITQAIQKAKQLSAEIVLFPELVLCGYPPEDLLLLPKFIDEIEKSLNEIALQTKGILAVVGTVRKNNTRQGKDLFNSAALLFDGKIIGFQDKILLPTYDVFDERRYFEPGDQSQIFNFHDKKIAVTICEDIWKHSELGLEFSDVKYQVSPIDELKKLQPDVILNLSSSPFCTTHFYDRLKVCCNAASTVNAPLFYCNQVGANDSLIFDGYSLVVNQDGEIVTLAKGFEEDLMVVEYPLTLPPKEIKENKLSDIYQALCLGVRDYFHKSGFKKAVLGLSGGIDSALVACIAVDALGAENVLAIAMPSRFSSNDSLIDAKALGCGLGCDFKEIPIEEPFKSYLNLLTPHFEEKEFDVTEENLQARIRGMILMAISNKFGYIVLSTGNKSEMALGYCTLYGDMCGGLSVIGDVTKTEVYELCHFINRNKEIIPWNTINKHPSAELKLNQRDQDTLPSYEIVDTILQSYLENHLSTDEISKKYNYPLKIVDDLIKRIHQNEYKRKQAPPGLRISKKAFTVGRRFPIVQKWI